MKNKLLQMLILMLLCATIGINESSLIAGTTGKITGIVRDRETNTPLPGTNVFIEGTTLGAATDMEGNYIIIGVPPGNYTIKASMMGYKSIQMEKVRISIDLTTTVNFSLEPTVLETAETVTVEAERPLVRMDMTSSLTTVSAEDIQALPVQDIDDVLELQAGIVKDGGNLHIRGGRAGEIAYWVDGIPTTDVFNGRMGVTVENSAVEELQVISGTFNAEYGQAMSGIVNIITKEGGKKYTGEVELYVGDYLSGDDKFSLLKSVTTEFDPDLNQTVAVGEKENPLKKFNPNYNAELSLSGPLPFLGDKLSFFVNGRYYFNEGHLYGRRWFKPTGVPGDSALVPMNPHRRYSTQGKLSFRMTPSIKATYTLFWSDWKNERTFSRDLKYVPDGRPQQMGSGMTHIFTLNHVLSQSTFYELRLNSFYNEYKQYLYENPYAKPDYLVKVLEDTAKGIMEEIFDYKTTAGATKLDSIKKERIQFEYIVDPNGPEGYVHPNWTAAPASYSFNQVGMDMWHHKRSTSYWVGKFDLTSQLTKIHQLKTGLEFRLHELELHQFTLRPRKIGEEEVEPFEPAIPEIGSIYRDDYLQKPREFSAYFQDKIELKEIILNVGLRFDYFDANSYIPTDPSDPNIYNPFKAEHIYKNWVPPAEKLSGNELDAYKKQFAIYSADERRAFMHQDVGAKWKLSPRLGIAYPITDQGVIHFSYGHFFQIPEFQHLYSNPDFKLSAGGGYTIFGNPDLAPQKTVQYEIGLQQQVTENIGIDVTLFYRDVRDWVGTSPLIDTPIPSVKYSQYENKDYENVRGITVKLEKRYSNNFSARLDYSFLKAEGTYSNPNDAYNDYQAQREPRRQLIPMNWDQNHTLNGWLTYRLFQWTFSLIGNYWTGQPYTPSFPRGEIVGGAFIGLQENSARLPTQKSVDLYINRQFSFGSVRMNLFANVYNLFDIRDETTVYGDTGTADYSTEIDPSKITYKPERIGTITDYVLQPGWYTAPRQIQLGMSLGF